MRLFDTEVYGDTITKNYVDDEGNIVIQKTQDHTGWLNRNRLIRDGMAPEITGLTHIGFIPQYLIDEWKSEGIDVFNKEDMPRVIAKLRTHEYEQLRTKDKI